jgi:hypothetical protein
MIKTTRLQWDYRDTLTILDWRRQNKIELVGLGGFINETKATGPGYGEQSATLNFFLERSRSRLWSWTWRISINDKSSNSMHWLALIPLLTLLNRTNTKNKTEAGGLVK